MTVHSYNHVRAGQTSMWLPGVIEVCYHDADAAEDNKVVCAELVAAQVNAVDREDITFTMSSGICHLDAGTHRVTQIVPGGTEYLEAIKHRLTVKPINAGNTTSTGNTTSIVLWLAIAVMILAYCALAMKLRNDPTNKSRNKTR